MKSLKYLRLASGIIVFIMASVIIIQRRNLVITGNIKTDYWIQTILGFVFTLTWMITHNKILDRQEKENQVIKNTCGHNNWGPVHEQFQYCRDCGISRPVEYPKCEQHKMEIISEVEVPNHNRRTSEVLKEENALQQIIFVNRCEHCGEIEIVGVDCTGKNRNL
jgi:hypothetical protein